MSRLRSPFRGKLSNVDISLLREFSEIVSAGGITAAEARLNKSKSAISIGLSNLEQRLGTRLCERGRSGFALTEQGRLIHTAIQQLINEIDRFSDFVGSTSRQLDGEIGVMIDDSFIFEMEEPVAVAIAKMNTQYPNLQMKIRMTAPDRIFSSVLEGNADLGFTGLAQPNEALDKTPLFLEEMGVFCGAEHPLFHVDDAQISYEDLQSFNFIEVNVHQSKEFREFLSQLNFTASAPTILSRMLLILSSRYLGFIPVQFAEHWVQKGSVREIRITNSRFRNTCCVIHRKARPLGLAAGIFKEILIKEVKDFQSE